MQFNNYIFEQQPTAYEVHYPIDSWSADKKKLRFLADVILDDETVITAKSCLED